LRRYKLLNGFLKCLPSNKNKASFDKKNQSKLNRIKLTLSLILLFTALQQGRAQPLLIDGNFYDKAASFYNKYVVNGLVNYQNVQSNTKELLDLLIYIDNASQEQLKKQGPEEQLAFYLNAYNLTVIKAVLLNYPINSPQAIPGFFDTQKHLIAGEYMTLNQLENEVIHPQFKDPRTHFALNCGALSCPPLLNTAFKPNQIDQQLEDLCLKAITNPAFVALQETNNKLLLSPIFDWYFQDFGGNKQSLIEFLNTYRRKSQLKPIPTNVSIAYKEYDWGLNEYNSSSSVATRFPKNEANRYFASALYKKGLYEIHLFNNLYYEQSKNQTNSQSFHSTLGRFLYGVNNRLNIGFDFRYRWTGQCNNGVQGAFHNFLTESTSTDPNDCLSRVELSGFGPKIKYTPNRKRANLSIQHSLIFPLGSNYDGKDGEIFIDYDGLLLFNQLFYDQPINEQFTLFFEIGLNVEGLPLDFFTKESTFFQISTPLTFIPSWFPDRRQTVYALFNMAPAFFYSVEAPNQGNPNQDNRFNASFNPWAQIGLGYKYRFLEKLEAELLYTSFHNSTEKRAHTFNLGLRFWR